MVKLNHRQQKLTRLPPTPTMLLQSGSKVLAGQPAEAGRHACLALDCPKEPFAPGDIRRIAHERKNLERGKRVQARRIALIPEIDFRLCSIHPGYSVDDL
jgi:hypothetical protein